MVFLFIKKMKLWLASLPIYGKFGRDILWNIISLIVFGLCGLIINFLIARIYGVEYFGVFNQVYVIYIIFSQLTVGGIHFSALKHIAEFRNSRETCQRIASSALVAVAVIAAFICLILYYSRYLFGNLLNSPAVAISLIYIIPGLFFFALNKVFLSIFNGLRSMKLYAHIQMLRYVLMLIILIYFVRCHYSAIFLSLIFTYAEIILFFILAIVAVRRGLIIAKLDLSWIKNHLKFGYQSFVSGFLIEVNTKIDVFILGIFANDRMVGVYSLAALAIEGLNQLINTARININPILTQLFIEQRISDLQTMICRGVNIFYRLMLGLGVGLIILYPLAIKLFLSSTEYLISWWPFLILMAGVILGSGYIPFNMLLLQVGRPKDYTKMMGFVVLGGIVLNFLLVPYLGMYGSAVAAGSTYILSAYWLKRASRKLIGLAV